jgi:shikimate dehydrogenase
VRGFQFEKVDPAIPVGALVLNATAAGLAKEGVAPVDLHTFPRPAAVYEMTYNPPVTALLRDAAALGLPHANGLGMLVHQGARSLSLWTGRPVPGEVMMRALLEARGEKRP